MGLDMMKRCALALSLLALMVQPSHAEGPPTASQIVQGFKANPDLVKGYVNGMGNGFLAANAMLERDSKTLLYCQPQKLGIAPEQYISMVGDKISKNPKFGSITFEHVLLLSLQETFPCR